MSSRYLTYFIQFVNSLFIASYLGPYYLGIWGFLSLIIQYFAQVNFGIPHALNVILAINSKNKRYSTQIFNTTLVMAIGISVLAVILFSSNYLFDWQIGREYRFNKYAPLICVIVVLNYFVLLFSNLARIHNKLFEIAFSQTAIPILMLICTFIAKGGTLVYLLVIANVIAYSLSIILFVRSCPLKIKPIVSIRLLKTVGHKAVYLFLYNSSFYLILISTRSFVSAYYTVSDFGSFTFAFMMANVVLLLFESFSFLILPKSINKLSSATNAEALNIITFLRDNYIVLTHGVMHIALLLFPLFLFFFPSYSGMSNTFRSILLAIVLYTNCFGYSSYLIAKGRQRQLGILALTALLINITASYILVKHLHVTFDKVIYATAITYLFYLVLLNYLGRKLLEASNAPLALLNSAFPFRLLAPYMVSLVLLIGNRENVFFIVPVILYLILNFTALRRVKDTLVKIVKQPDVINI